MLVQLTPTTDQWSRVDRDEVIQNPKPDCESMSQVKLQGRNHSPSSGGSSDELEIGAGRRRGMGVGRRWGMGQGGRNGVKEYTHQGAI